MEGNLTEPLLQGTTAMQYRVYWNGESFLPNYGRHWQAAFEEDAEFYLWAWPLSREKPNTIVLSVEEARAIVAKKGQTSAGGPKVRRILGLHVAGENVDFAEPVEFY